MTARLVLVALVSTVSLARPAHPTTTAPALWIERQDGPNIRAIRTAFHQYGHKAENQAIRVAACESTGDHDGSDGYRLEPTAHNGSSTGLFELHRPSHEARARRLGFTWPQMFQAGPNALVAADLYGDGEDFHQWRWSQSCWAA